MIFGRARRINKIYRREAAVIYPPVDTDGFTLHEEKEDYYFTVSRLVPYKKIDLIVEAFAEMPDKKLVVIGAGPEYERIKAKAGPNTELLGYQPFEMVKHHMARAKAFVFAAEEDFGIVPVEAQACGTPVIALGRGGALETVIEGETGLFFPDQTTTSLKEAIRRFEAGEVETNPKHIRAHAERFSNARFKRELEDFIAEGYVDFQKGRELPKHFMPAI